MAWGLGLAYTSNDWVGHAKENQAHSKSAIKAQSKATLKDESGLKGRENDWKATDWREPRRKSEGKCWTISNDQASRNSYTGPGGSKH
jgi:hypothetical protein